MIELPPLFQDSLPSSPGPSSRDLARFTPDAVLSALGPLFDRNRRDEAVSVYERIAQLAQQALQEPQDEPDPVAEASWSEQLASDPRREALVPRLARPETLTDYLHAFAPGGGRMAFPWPGGAPNPIRVGKPSRYALLEAMLANPYQKMAGVSVFDAEGRLLGSLATGTDPEPGDAVSAIRKLALMLPETRNAVVFAHQPVLRPRSRSALGLETDTLSRDIREGLKQGLLAPVELQDVLFTSPTEFWGHRRRLWGRVADDFEKLPGPSRETIRAVSGPEASRAAGEAEGVWRGVFPIQGLQPVPLYEGLGRGAELLGADGLIVTPPARDVAAREGLGLSLAERGLRLLGGD